LAPVPEFARHVKNINGMANIQKEESMTEAIALQFALLNVLAAPAV